MVWEAFEKLKEKCANYDTVDEFVDLKREIEKLEKVVENSVFISKDEEDLPPGAWVRGAEYRKKVLENMSLKEKIAKLETVIENGNKYRSVV